ncbi:MAG: GspH/FimT family pseudopilin [Pseudomonadales bacterium]|jgi:type IV fimbrial biogenesis protein FimT
MVRRGFTVLELLAVLAIAITLGALAYPSFDDLVARVHSTSRINAIVSLLRFARETAVTQHRWVTLCPASAEVCTGSTDWSTGIMAFADLNRDGTRQTGEPVLAYQSALDPGERLTWRAFRRHNFLQFRSEGYTNWQNGSFVYCPASGDPRNGKVLIVNIQGRTALSTDRDGDGVDEQANGAPLTC